MTRDGLKRALKLWAANWPTARGILDVAPVWEAALGAFDDDAVWLAVCAVIGESTTVTPPPVGAILTRLKKSPTPDADQAIAWNAAIAWITATEYPIIRNGKVAEIPEPDPAVVWAVKAMGRDVIRHRTPENETYIRTQFGKVWTQARTMAELPSLSPGAPVSIGGLLPQMKGDEDENAMVGT